MKFSIFDKKGKEIKQIDAPKEIFGVSLNKDLVHEVMVSMKSNSRSNIAHTKDRAEVSGGGKKPWRQKGLGRARHGSIRSPIWIGGGITFGPRNDKNYSRKINKKVAANALAMVLSQKALDNEIILIDSLKMDSIKSKDAAVIVNAFAKHKDFSGLSLNKKSSAVIVLSERDEKTVKSFRNLKNIQLDLVKNINVIDLLNSKYLIIENPEKSFEILNSRVVIGKK
jgi:large subunit ribosomal protein L4